MEVVREIPLARAAVARARQAGRQIGLVPTMGALHRAHESLIAAACKRGLFSVVSIFVNPTQFVPGEDYEAYPRDEAADLEVCRAAGVELVFIPPVADMYASDAVTRVHVSSLTATLCGAHRPGHFDGVTTVCTKLFNILQPDVAFFGEKDAQQLAVIRRMVRDLDLPLEIVGCATIREPDGLALSSRNRYLSAEQRQQAVALNRALQAGAVRVRSGKSNADSVVAAMKGVLAAAGAERIDYVEVVDPDSLQPVSRIDGPVLLALAVHIGPARLIDNLTARPDAAAAAGRETPA
jgi:pantoate--beta-alanine ligase